MLCHVVVVLCCFVVLLCAVVLLFWLCWVCCVSCVVCCVLCVLPTFRRTAPPPDNPLRDRPSAGPVPLDPPVCVCCVCLVQDLCPGPLPRTAPPPDRPKFRAFFPSPPQFSFFLLSLGGPFVEFGGGPEMCTFCETPAAPPDRAAGARTRQPENSKRAHFRAPALQKPHQNSTKRPPRERRKKENCGREGKKARNCGPPPFGGPPFWVWAPLRAPLRGPHPSGAHHYRCGLMFFLSRLPIFILSQMSFFLSRLCLFCPGPHCRALNALDGLGKMFWLQTISGRQLPAPRGLNRWFDLPDDSALSINVSITLDKHPLSTEPRCTPMKRSRDGLAMTCFSHDSASRCLKSSRSHSIEPIPVHNLLELLVEGGSPLPTRNANVPRCFASSNNLASFARSSSRTCLERLLWPSSESSGAGTRVRILSQHFESPFQLLNSLLSGSGERRVGGSRWSVLGLLCRGLDCAIDHVELL